MNCAVERIAQSRFVKEIFLAIVARHLDVGFPRMPKTLENVIEEQGEDVSVYSGLVGLLDRTVAKEKVAKVLLGKYAQAEQSLVCDGSDK